jgi:hypothetical protein
MARQNVYPAPWKKHMEAYNDFGGGLNTVTSNDNLRVDECPDLINVDLGSRGSLARRYGMVAHLAKPALASGLGQGYFRYYVGDGTFQEILAIGGKLWKDGVELPITSLASFQTTRLIEAVQYKNILYIATGTKFVQYDGTEAKVVVPYTPDPLEALYIGTNGLADNPDAYLTDGTGSVLKITGLTVDLRYGVINAPSTFTAYVSTTGSEIVEYRFEYRVRGADTWILGQDWSTTKVWEFVPLVVDDFEIRALIRDQAVPTTEYEYVMPRYTVNETDENSQIPHDTMHDCNRILLYWDRIILYSDPTQPTALFISHLKNMSYFPIPNSLEIENDRQEPLNIIKPYRDSLVAFTDTSFQAIFGKAPAEFVRIRQHTSIGCIAPESAVVVENSLFFRSSEGIHALRSVSVSDNRADVRRVDTNIENIIPLDTDACGIVFDNQYHVLFPQQNKRLRYYYTQKRTPWTKDESTKLDFSKFYKFGDSLYGQSQSTGAVYQFDEGAVDDAGASFTDFIKFKSFDFGEPYNPKKLKELQVLVEQQTTIVNSTIKVYADASLVLGADESYASVDANGNVVWNAVSDPNLTIDSGTVFGSWELGTSAFGSVDSLLEKLSLYGKCRRVTITIEHSVSEKNRFLGCAFIFKVKKP